MTLCRRYDLNKEIDFQITRYKTVLKRYKNFNWKSYFLKTFAFLFLLYLFIYAVFPEFHSRPLSMQVNMLAVALWSMLAVCAIFTPLMTYWYQKRYLAMQRRLRYLMRDKRDVEHKRWLKCFDSNIYWHVHRFLLVIIADVHNWNNALKKNNTPSLNTTC